jgi:hypothetical protein
MGDWLTTGENNRDNPDRILGYLPDVLNNLRQGALQAAVFHK